MQYGQRSKLYWTSRADTNEKGSETLRVNYSVEKEVIDTFMKSSTMLSRFRDSCAQVESAHESAAKLTFLQT